MGANIVTAMMRPILRQRRRGSSLVVVACLPCPRWLRESRKRRLPYGRRCCARPDRCASYHCHWDERGARHTRLRHTAHEAREAEQADANIALARLVTSLQKYSEHLRMDGPSDGFIKPLWQLRRAVAHDKPAPGKQWVRVSHRRGIIRDVQGLVQLCNVLYHVQEPPSL